MRIQPYIEFDDDELVILLKNGDRTAYEEIFNRYNGLLFQHAFKKLGNKEEARDLVQDVYASVWAKRTELNIYNNLAGYLYSAVRNRFYNIIAHKKIESDYFNSLQSFITDKSAITDHLIREKQLIAIIEQEIESLPPRMRQIFELSRKRHLSHKEIADELGISEHTVTTQVKKALKILRPRLMVAVYLVYLLKS